MRLLQHYERLQAFIPDFTTESDAVFALNNMTALLERTDWKQVRKDILTTDADWLVLKEKLAFSDDFVEQNRETVTEFLLQGGFVVACAECGLEYSSGRADIKGTAMNLIKGFMAVSLFTVVPIRLYELCVSLQANFGYAISGAGASFGTVAGNIIDELTVENFADFATTHVGGFGSVTSPIMVLFCIILMAYAVIKVFFANLKRGGILLIQIAVGSLYMFSVPRGYLDGFYQWCKQVVGLCLTAFLQATILIAGLSLFNEHALLGLGLMLSAGEIPRIAGAFGLDTSTRANLSSAVYTAQTAINITKTVAKAAAA